MATAEELEERIKRLEQTIKNLRHQLNAYGLVALRRAWDYADDKHGGLRK